MHDQSSRTLRQHRLTAGERQAACQASGGVQLRLSPFRRTRNAAARRGTRRSLEGVWGDVRGIRLRR